MSGLNRELAIIAWDDPVFDAWAVEVSAEFRRRRLVQGYGITISEQPSGTVIECTIDPPRLRHAKTRAGGIAAATSVTQMTSGTVDIWRPDAAGLLTAATGEEAVAWNKATEAVAANTHIMILTDDSGLDLVLWEPCP